MGSTIGINAPGTICGACVMPGVGTGGNGAGGGAGTKGARDAGPEAGGTLSGERGGVVVGGGQEVVQLGEVDGELHAALRAAEAGEAVGHVEHGLAVGAGSWIFVGSTPAPAGRKAAPPPPPLRDVAAAVPPGGGAGVAAAEEEEEGGGLGISCGEALRHAALGADELGHAWATARTCGIRRSAPGWARRPGRGRSRRPSAARRGEATEGL